MSSTTLEKRAYYAEYSKQRRAKEREAIGSIEYKKKQAAKKRAWRAKKKVEEASLFAADGVNDKYADELKTLSNAIKATLKQISEGKDVTDTLPARKEQIANAPSQIAKVQK